MNEQLKYNGKSGGAPGQAGGLQRMLLRGHTAPLTALLLSPTGTDLVTGSACGELRVWCLDIGDW